MGEDFMMLIGIVFAINAILDFRLHRKLKEEYNEKFDDIKKEINTLKEDVVAMLDPQSEKACSMQNKSVQDNDSLSPKIAELCRLCIKEIVMNNITKPTYMYDFFTRKISTDNRYSDISVGGFHLFE